MTEKKCFVIAPIGEAESDTRKRSDQILKHVITPAMKECGYKATRADQISEPGMITSQVIQRIVDDPLVVADLTERNPNVFYELAIRHAIRKPLVQIIKKGELIPFDVAGTRTIHVDHHDLDSVEQAKTEIIAQVKALEKNPANLETPISVSLDLQVLRQSDNPEQRSLADVLSVITELRSTVLGLEKRFDNPEGLIPREYLKYVSESQRMKSAHSEKMATEMRQLLEELQQLTLSEKSSSKSNNPAKDNRIMRIQERIMHIKSTLEMMMHDRW